MKIIKLVCSIVLLMQCAIAFGQGDRTVLIRPKEYELPKGDLLKPNTPRMNVDPMNIWIVYSDKANNQTYYDTSAAKDNPRMKMDFLEKFVVVGESNDFIEIVKVQDTEDLIIKSDGDYKVRKKATYYGWVPKSEMLLWRNAVVDSETKYTTKALSVNTIESLKNIEEYVKNDKQLTLFSDPGLKIANNNDFRMYDFLFIYKETATSYLVGKSYTIKNTYYPQYIILGWVSKNLIQKWAQRLCLEPNGDPEAVKERQAKNTKTSLFPTLADATAFGQGKTVTPFWDFDPYGTKQAPEVKRFPVIESLDGKVHTGVVSGVLDIFNKMPDGSPRQVLTSDEQYKIEKEYNNLRQNYRNINIVFVMDGSEALSNYHASVMKAVEKTLTLLKEQEAVSANKFKVGAVIYRDESERLCATGDIEFAVEELSTQHNKVINFLNKEGKPKNCNSKDLYRSLYGGLDKAIRMLARYENETNVMILIGSGGNKNGGTIQSDGLAKAMQQYGISLFAFQTYHNGEQVCYDFYEQASELMSKSGKLMQDVYANMFPDRKKVQISYIEKNNKVQMLDCPATSPVPGKLMMGDSYNPITSTELADEILITVKELLQIKEEILIGMDSKIKGQGKREIANEGMYNFLANMNVDVNLLRQTSYENVQFFTEAYTVISRTGDKHPLYNYVLFLTESEYQTLINNLNKIFDPSLTISEQRSNIRDVFISLLETYYGSEEMKGMRYRLTPSQFMALLNGLPSKSEILSKYKIDDFTDERIVPNADIERLMRDMQIVTKNLERILDDPAYYFLSNDIRYYWIPQKMLP